MWFWKRDDSNKRHWRLEMHDDFGDWGNIDWIDLISKATVNFDMKIICRPSVEREAQTLDKLTEIVTILGQKGVIKHVYGERHLRMYNFKTGEAIPLEALGIEMVDLRTEINAASALSKPWAVRINNGGTP